MRTRSARSILLIALSQFGMAFSFNFVLVFIPFYLPKISPYRADATLVWLGLIMGAPSFAAAFFSTAWGTLASRKNPKLLFMVGLLSHAIVILAMGFVRNLPLLLALRLVQGVLGGISTVGFLIVSRSSTPEHASRDIGLYQNAMTLGQLTGPPVGALTASLMGYTPAFVSAGTLILLTLVFCFLYVDDVAPEGEPRHGPGGSALTAKGLASWGLCFTATVQLMFLPSVLPEVFRASGVAPATALELAGVIVMFYTASAMLGTYAFCRFVGRIGTKRLILGTGAAGVLLQALLCVAHGLLPFLVLRMLQTAAVAATLPLVIASFGAKVEGRVIGFLNSGRFAGNALGPMIATSVLAATNLTTLYLLVSVLGALALAGFLLVRNEPVSR